MNFMLLYRLAPAVVRRIALVFIAMTACCYGWAQSGAGNVCFHNEASDTLVVNDVLTRVLDAGLQSSGQRVAFVGKLFVDKPYVAHTLEGEEECLRVNVDEFDCTTFVETVLALAKTAGEGRASWRDFVYNLEQLRYRGGELDGYGSRLHYICDWILDNSYRGNVKDASDLFEDVAYAVKTVDYMTAHRKSYPALADSANYAAVKKVEEGFRNHRFGYLKTRSLGKKAVRNALRDGDVLAFTSTLRDLDVTHLGIVVRGADGEPHVLHASSSAGKVAVSDVPLVDFVKRNLGFTGVRVVRLR